ncbi:MAG: Na/Pi cotransporter family protein [Planctomycetota bacterium]|jgi:phosphate:Na+ symporter
MVKDMIFFTVGGLGLFLFGMGLMSDGLKKVAGQKLRTLLGSLTKHRVIAVAVGALTTCLIQSSSATTVMTVGFVHAGLLTLKQALCVVLGANVGTTFTAWLVSTIGIEGLKITGYALPAIGIGLLLKALGRKQWIRSTGQIMLGFGLLFIGIGFMKDAFGPLEGNAEVQKVLISLGQHPLLAVLAGTVITMLLQSSSASIMMVQVLALQGAFGTDPVVALRIAIPFILGDNIGTTITAQIAAVQTSRNAKRVAMGHTIFNVMGVAYMLPLVSFGLYARMVEFITPLALELKWLPVHIAVAHSTFNVFNTLVFIPIIAWLEWIVMKLLPIRTDELEEKPVVLERHLLHTPIIALDQAKREILRMTERAQKAFHRAVMGMLESDRKLLAKVAQTEDTIDEFQSEITSYLVALSRRQLSNQVSIELPVLLHTVNDLERVGDHAVNIVEIAERKIEQKLIFGESARAEADKLKAEIDEMFENISLALGRNDIEAARRALVNEEHLNQMQIDFRRSHVQRMTDGICSPQAGLIFIDLVDNIEKIGDHLTNIAQAVMGGLHWDGIEAKSY